MKPQQRTAYGLRKLPFRLLVALTVLSAAGPAFATPFVQEHVQAPGMPNLSTASIALDAEGNPHFSCYDGTNSDLLYASRVGGVWIFETVDGLASNVGAYNSLALDSDGNPHIAYKNNGTGDLKYAVRRNGAWTSEFVDQPNDVGGHASLALDAAGNPHIAYDDATTNSIKYATKVGLSWTIQTVHAGIGYAPSIAVDALGQVHIAYFGSAASDLWFASKVPSGTWVLDLVDDVGSVGWEPSIALDATGIPHIAYHDATNNRLKYARRAGAVWIFEIADPAIGGLGGEPSLVIDGSGAPHVVYRDLSSLETHLKYAVRTGSTWESEFLTGATTLTGYAPSMALDVQGSPRVVYGEAGGQSLVYADASIHLLAPMGGEIWPAGSQQTVRWTGGGSVAIEISRDGGATYTTLLPAVSGGSALVNVPGWSTSDARVRASRSAPFSTSESPGSFTIAPASPTPAAVALSRWTATGAAGGDQLGFAVAPAGDFNADGYPDAIAGAPYNDAGGADAGRAYIYYGGTTSDATADVTITGIVFGDSFGASVAAGGDFNDDGYDDALVGAPGSDAVANNAGRAYLVYGGPGADNFPDLGLNGAAADDQFGYAVAGGADLNGDGIDDVAVGAPYNDTPGQDAGRAYVFFGSRSPNNTPDLILSGKAALDNFGASLSIADVNDDGYSDLVVGSPFEDVSAGNDAGAVYVYYGGPDIDNVADAVLRNDRPSSYFGFALAAFGAANPASAAWPAPHGVVISALGLNGATGAAYRYLWNGAAGLTLDRTYLGKEGGEFYGYSVAAGDWNGDGLEDLAVGAPYSSLGGVNAGRIEVFHGGIGADVVPDHAWTGVAGEQLGWSLAAPRDLGGNGFARDLIAGATTATGPGASAGKVYARRFGRYLLAAPNGGETWQVGALKELRWQGAEPADVWLSVDGGIAYELLRGNAGGAADNVLSLRVPHSPTKFARVRLTPSDASVSGEDTSDSLFTIQTSVSLLAMLAAPLPQGGASVSWNTNPGPEDLSGYRLARAATGSSDWRTIVALTRETSYTDPDGGPGTRYRLFAVNGFGEELWLGEAVLRPLAPLAAWPMPYRSGDLTVSFATYGGLGGGAGGAEVSLYDVRGRLVRVIARGSYRAGYQSAVWDGRDRNGHAVAAGVYFIRTRSAGQDRAMKLTVLR